MSGRTGKADVKLRGAKNTSGNGCDFTGRAHHGQMGAEQIIDVIQKTGSGLCSSAAHAFFCRLENEFDASRERIFVVDDPASERQADGGMSVVPAGMHGAGMF